MSDVIKTSPRGVGSNGGWASLVTGQLVKFGPDLSLFVASRADAYTIADWLTSDFMDERNRAKRVDRCHIDYRDFEPHWLQVKLIVEEEHRVVLERLSEALYLRDGYLDKRLLDWAVDPMNNWDVAKGYQSHHREELEAMRRKEPA
jgi:hypothetical protein